jgi:endo-1,4-beta-xylanase
MRKALLLASLLSAGAAARADEPAVVLLWPDGAPGSEGRSEPEKVRLSDGGERVVSGVHRPSLTVYLPDAATATGAGIVVMPGGGHRELWTDHEGHRVAAWLSAHGVSAFVLKYRLAREEGSRYTVEDHALADARRALRTVRQRAAEWRVDPQRLGVMGFSAGGELAALAAMRGETGRPDATDPVERQGAQPAFQVLGLSRPLPEHPADAAVAACLPSVRRRRPARHLRGASRVCTFASSRRACPPSFTSIPASATASANARATPGPWPTGWTASTSGWTGAAC